MSRRVVVTGMGAITPIGLSVNEFWDGVKQGKIGFAPITKFDAADFKCKLAAEVKGFEGKNYMDFKAAKRMELFSQYAVAATKEAMEDAGLDMEKEDPYRVGVAVGSGTGSLQAMERAHSRLLEKGPGRIEPLFVPLTISNMAAGNVSIQFGYGYELDWRGIPVDSVRRRGRDGSGWYGGKRMSYRHWRLFRIDGAVLLRRSREVFDSL